jgi:hypothetical protein
MAMGSASELENHLLLAKDLHFLEEPSYRNIEPKVIETKKMLAALIKKIEVDRRQWTSRNAGSRLVQKISLRGMGALLRFR